MDRLRTALLQWLPAPRAAGVALVAALAGAAPISGAAANEPAAASPAAAHDPAVAGLFDADAPINVVLEVPVLKLRREKLAQAPVPGKLHFKAPDGREGMVPVTVRTRGNTRLQGCLMPPLRLEFDRAHTGGTPFAGQGKLKLVTHCRPEDPYFDYVRLEQRIYQAFALLTPVAFRTRALTVTYLDSGERLAPLPRPAFLIEDVDDLAKRAGLREVKVARLAPGEVDPSRANLLELFQFLIGNTDFSSYRPSVGSEECCHNGKVLRARDGSGPYLLVPYDFDASGLIDAEYASVHPSVGVRRVRQRVYRGLCTHNAEVPATIRRFQEVRAPLEAVFQGGGVSPAASRRALRYVQDFYRIIGDPAEVQRLIYDACRPEPASPSAAGSASDAAASLGRTP